MIDNLRDWLGLHLTAVLAVTGKLADWECEVHDDRTFCSSRSSGLAVVVDAGGQIIAIHLHSDGHEGFHEYSGGLPEGVTFGLSRGETRRILGQPQTFAEGGLVPILGVYGAWDRYAYDGVFLHLQFSSADKLELLTLQSVQS
jgi:hypothetical protein